MKSKNLFHVRHRLFPMAFLTVLLAFGFIFPVRSQQSTDTNTATLRILLHQAVQNSDWKQSIQLVDELLKIQKDPTETESLKAYRIELQNRLHQDSKTPPPSSLPEKKVSNLGTYSIFGRANLSDITISGSFTPKDVNNDKLIDKSELSYFQVTLVVEGITVDCGLPSLTEFKIDDSKDYLQLIEQVGYIPALPLGLTLKCESKDVKISFTDGGTLTVKIASSRNFSNSEQHNNSQGIEVSFSTGSSWEEIEFTQSFFPLNIKINGN